MVLKEKITLLTPPCMIHTYMSTPGNTVKPRTWLWSKMSQRNCEYNDNTRVELIICC